MPAGGAPALRSHSRDRTAGTLHGWLVPRLVFPLYERVTGRRLWTEVQRLRTLQWRPPEELEARAVARLRALLAHAAAHVPHYRETFGAAGVDVGAVRSLGDLARLPLTTKAALRRRFPDGVTADNVGVRRRWTSTTSGSTGFPFHFYADTDSADETLGSYLFFLEWAGTAIWQTRLDLGVREGRSWVAAPWLGRGTTRLGRRVLLGEDVRRVLSVDITPGALQAVVARISARRGYFIRAYPAYASRLGARLLEDGVELPIAPRAVVSCAETLTPTRAAVIGRAFRAPVVNHYSCWEVLHLAQTCPDRPELLHVNPERGIVWVAREDGTPAAPREQGRLVLTALSNYVQPFINYDIGDRGAAAGPCPCGRGWPTLAGLEGRTAEVIRTPAGRLMSPILLSQLPALGPRAVPRIWEYQARQTAPDRVVLRVVPAAEFTPAVADELAGDLRACLGPDVRVEIDVVEQIPAEPSGKRPVIVPLPARAADA